MKEIALDNGKIMLCDDNDYLLFKHMKICTNYGDGKPKYARTWSFIRSKEKGKKGNNKCVLIHKLLIKCPPGMVIDHINRNGFDNRRENLRVVSQKENSRNQGLHKLQKNGFKGIRKRPSKHQEIWQAFIMVDYKQINLGYYKTKEEAARARDIGTLKYHGPYGHLNFPRENYENTKDS